LLAKHHSSISHAHEPLAAFSATEYVFTLGVPGFHECLAWVLKELPNERTKNRKQSVMH